jgi:hypothetical protein
MCMPGHLLSAAVEKGTSITVIGAPMQETCPITVYLITGGMQ